MKTNEHLTLKSKGVSSDGEILVSSSEVQRVIQDIIDSYESALCNQRKEIAEEFADCVDLGDVAKTARNYGV